MIKKSKTKDNLKVFNFYTYDPTGRSVVIPVRAANKDDAWTQFQKTYSDHHGQVPLVDFVIDASLK